MCMFCQSGKVDNFIKEVERLRIDLMDMAESGGLRVVQ